MSRFDFRDGGLPPDVLVVAVRGVENVSQPYEFDIWLVLTAAACAFLDLDSLLGERATFIVKEHEDASDEAPYFGILREVELVHAAGNFALLRVVLVPELFKLTQSSHSRAYTFQKLDAVIGDVFARAELTMPWSITQHEAHREEEHIVQYRESDHAFLSRWLEREGFFYFFKHGSKGIEELEIIDTSSSAENCAVVRYRPVAGGDTSAGASLASFRALECGGPASLTLTGQDYVKPALKITGSATVEGGGGTLVLGDQRTFSPEDAQRLATLHGQERVAKKVIFTGRGTLFGVRPGFVIELDEHPRLSGRYFVTRVEHRGMQGELAFGQDALELAGVRLPPGYEVTIECIAAEVPYRAPRNTPWPSIHGYQLGRIDGPADDDYAQLDHHGRYLVKLFLDEGEVAGANASTRIRMMQPHVGNPEGWHFPLRKGTEVVVQFLQGDPDRPVIAGAVPNTVTPSVVTKSNATQNVLQTGGSTRIEVEDAKGKQFIWIHTPPANTHINLGHPEHGTHNITLHSDKDCLYDIGTNQLIEVGGVLDERVVSDVKETYSSDQTSTIDGPQKTTVDGAVSELYLSTQKTTVTKQPRNELFQNGHDTLVVGPRSETYSGSQMQQVFGSTSETWIGNWTRGSGATSETHVGNLTEMVLGPSMEICPSGVVEKYGDTTALWASLLWIGSSVDYTAPDLTDFQLFRSENVVADHKDTEPTINGWGLTDISASTLKLESLGIFSGFTAGKVEINGVALALNGLVCEPGVVKIDLVGFQLSTTGAYAVI